MLGIRLHRSWLARTENRYQNRQYGNRQNLYGEPQNDDQSDPNSHPSRQSIMRAGAGRRSEQQCPVPGRKGFRLLNEERVLLVELSGYPGYCRCTRFRLIPFVW